MIWTCVVTHDRLAYTRRCIESLLATQRPGDGLIVVDNASTDGTVAWLRRRRVRVIGNEDNRFPGAATNQGWDAAPPEALYLHRSDNDIEYHHGWQAEVEAQFAAHPDIALLGILNLHEDRGTDDRDATDVEWVSRVGGNVVMPAVLFRSGLRWDERPWAVCIDEDGPMSWAAGRRGRVARLRRTVADNMAFCRFADLPDYYRRTATLRGIRDAEHSV